MKKFIINITLFGVLLFSTACLVDYMITTGLKRMDDYRYKTWTDFVKKPVNADVVVNGNSRAFSHFVPQVIDSFIKLKAYNLGIGGTPFEGQYLKYHFYLQYNTKPRIVIQNVDFITLVDVNFIGHEREQFFPYVFTPYMRNELGKFGFEKQELYLPAVRYFGYQHEVKDGLLSFFNFMPPNRRTVFSGFSAENGIWNPTELNQLDTIKFSRDKRSVILFERYLEECQKDSISVFLVNSPVFYRATAKLQENDKMNEFFCNMAKKYGAMYLNYTDDPMCMDSSNFVVAVHLNEKAAYKFSKKLALDVDSILIQKKMK